ncbi:MAG: hypothetical protein JNK63_00310 [Chthonomonas sp.]|nr:hypothetical protein [Chthonomonas sp.]
MAKTWQQKLHNGKDPVVEVMDKAMWGLPIGTKLLIPTPLMVDAYMRAIPRGEARSLVQMRETFAHESGADATCPLTSGIFLRIVAEAAHEEMSLGKSQAEVAPFWRMIDAKAPVRKKLTFDPAMMDALRAEEGL